MQCSSEKLVRKKSSVNYGKLLSGVWTEKTLGFASSEDISQTVPNDHDYVDMDVGVSTPNIAADKMETIGKIFTKIVTQDSVTCDLILVENNQERKHLNKNEAAPIADEFDQSLVASENRKILLRYTSKDVSSLSLKAHNYASKDNNYVNFIIKIRKFLLIDTLILVHHAQALHRLRM